MTTKTSSFQFRLTGVEGTPFNTNTRQNVKKNIAKILYLESPPNAAVRLAYVGSKEITPTVNLFIGDRSDSIYANAIGNTEEFISLDDTAYSTSVANSNFLFTQEFVEADSGYIPLYYKHTLSSLVVLESVRVFDQNFNDVSSDKWKLVREYEWDDDTGTTDGTVLYYHLFNSLENTFDQNIGTYSVYFVQYTTLSGSTYITTTEILNNELGYKPATASDFWYLTPGELKPWVFAYHYEPPASVLFPSVGKFAIKYIATKRISVKHPVDHTDTEPWFPRVINGTFTNGVGGAISSKYSIPEFDNQAFNPISPYKVAARKLCEKVDKRLLKLPHTKIQEGSMFNYISIEFEKDGATEYALTTDPLIAGTTYFDFDGNRVYDSNGDEIVWSSDDLLGFDRESGIVHVNFDISDAHYIYATYPYEEEYYSVSSLIMNPIFDSYVHKQIRIIYIVPTNIANNNSSTQTASVMWLKVSRSGVIQDTNQNSDGGNEDIKFNTVLANTSGYKLSGVLGMHYSWQISTIASAQSPATVVEVIPDYPLYVTSTDGFPKSGWLRARDTNEDYRYFKYVDKTDTSFILSDQTTEVPTDSVINIPDGETVELVTFINERCTLTNRVWSTELAGYPSTGYPSMASQYFVLAEMAVNSSENKTNLAVIDIREDGGGIKQDLYNEAKAINPQIQWLNDYQSFDGQIYPSNAVIVIKLPKTILDDFSLDNVRNIVSEKVPYGIYPLIRFYGYEPRVVSILPGTAVGSVDVTWEKEGSEFTYDIWYAHNESGPWTKANTFLLTDGTGTYNSYTIEGLIDDAPYLIKLTMQDRYYSWWYGYSGHNSISGGLGLDEDTPTAPFGNLANFQFEIL